MTLDGGSGQATDKRSSTGVRSETPGERVMLYLGVDFGGTKIEAAALSAQGEILGRERLPNPGNYDAAIDTVLTLVNRVETLARSDGAYDKALLPGVGVGIPGSVSPRTHAVRNANSRFLNGRDFRSDLEKRLGKPVRVSNDANCLALSEALDGAAAGKKSVVAVIMGTGFGGGLVLNGELVEGANGIAGELGHFGLPWAQADEAPGPECWCGRRGCVETWISGTGFARDYSSRTGKHLTAEEIIKAMANGDKAAADAFDRFISRLGRTLAAIVNIYDPDAFVFGGGLSNVPEIYARLPEAVRAFVFSDSWDASFAPARWGDSSGVRGAAFLWRTQRG